MGISYRRKFCPLIVITAVLLSLSACGGEGGGQDQDGPSSDDLLAAQAHLSIAELYRSQGQFRASTIEAQNALQLIPDNSDALSFMAQLSMDLGDNSRAVELLAVLHENRPGDVQITLRLSAAYLVSGTANEAQLLLEDLALPAGAERDELNLMRGTIAMLSGDLAAAEESFQAVLGNDSKNIDALILSSQIEAQSGVMESASNYLDQAILAEPRNLDVWIWRAQFAMLQEDYPAAEEAYSEALNIMALYDTMTAKRFTIMQGIITPLQQQQKDAEALQYTQLLADTPQGQIINNYSTALNMYKRGDMQRADEALNSILGVIPNNPNSNILMGMTRYAQGNFIEANDLLTRFIDIESAAPELIKTLAAARLRVNQPELALSALQQALQRYPEDPSLMAMLGAAQQALGNFDESVSLFRQALSLSREADSAEMYLALAVSNFQLQDFPSAEDGLLESLRLNPLSQEAKTLLIDVYLVQGNLDSAQSQAQSWLEEDPESIFYNEAAGVVALRQGNYDQARGYFTDILEVESDHIQSRLTLARLDLIEGKYQDAVASFASVLEIQIDNSDAIGGLLAAGASNGSEDSSIAIVQGIIDENDTLFVPPLTLAQYFLATDRLDRGREYADIAIARDNNFYTEGAIIDVRLAGAGLMREERNVAEALDLVESVLSLRDDHIQALTMAAALHADRDEYDQAKVYVARIQELMPELPFAYEVAGDLFLAESDAEAALLSYEQAWELGVSSNLGVKLHDLYRQFRRSTDADRLLSQWTQALPEDATGNLLLGMDYEGQNRGEEAVAQYEKVYLVDPDNLLVLNNLAWLYQDSSPARALELASRAAELYPDNADVLDTYGWILGKQNNRSEAIAVLERALELSPQAQSIMDHLTAVRAQTN